MIEINDGIILKEDSTLEFYNKVDKIIPISDRRYKIPDGLKKICIVFTDGDVIIEKNNKNNLSIRSYLTTCTKRGYEINRIFLSDMSIIRKLYESNKENERIKLIDEQPMERAAAALLKDACSLGASDIHIEVKEHEASVYYRVNGDMRKIDEIESEEGHSLLASLYNAADNADATYKLYAFQSARISNGCRISMPPELQSIRLQFNPLASGCRYMIARLLYANKNFIQKTELSEMGFHASQIKIINELAIEPEGVNLVAGPTGSGKSTTLKIILENIYIEKERKVNIISIEDPPEYEIEGTKQLPVTNVDTEEERGAAYSKAIVSALRSDPDIIMPGEARDSAVIKLVFTAAMTGHQVWSSIHTNSAMAVISRLRDQGVEQYKLTDPKLLTGIISQRLVKKLCNNCKVPISENQFNLRYGINLSYILNDVKGYEKNVFVNNPLGCEDCNGGYSGRVVVAEAIRTDFKLLELVYDNKIEDAYAYWREHLNGLTIIEHGWLKVISGIIDPFDARVRLGGEIISEERKKKILGMSE
ncbi:GspE/PulE family protein [Yokenella regensburgei]|uniref:GspE/PulE family protein n=1 Tax=Yokenella regensburgei TaxID=158877 RepID=UPI0014333591|nr:ATPase, T2SS/T4P/T4SS family [Yokenella regensburgei]QIU90109.1 Flp pilus assembly complex ATPase component TadA [Yokenella regensburgei]